MLDAGAFIALDRRDPTMTRLTQLFSDAKTRQVTSVGVVAQVWRGGRGNPAKASEASDKASAEPRVRLHCPVDRRRSRSAPPHERQVHLIKAKSIRNIPRATWTGGRS